MKLLIKTTHDFKCCPGFGVFDNKYPGVDLVKCPKCSSIHPEVLGLTHMKDGKPIYLYVIEEDTKFMKFMKFNSKRGFYE